MCLFGVFHKLSLHFFLYLAFDHIHGLLLLLAHILLPFLFLFFSFLRLLCSVFLLLSFIFNFLISVLFLFLFGCILCIFSFLCLFLLLFLLLSLSFSKFLHYGLRLLRHLFQLGDAIAEILKCHGVDVRKVLFFGWLILSSGFIFICLAEAEVVVAVEANARVILETHGVDEGDSKGHHE